jgi:hypothetical protein
MDLTADETSRRKKMNLKQSNGNSITEAQRKNVGTKPTADHGRLMG